MDSGCTGRNSGLKAGRFPAPVRRVDCARHSYAYASGDGRDHARCDDGRGCGDALISGDVQRDSAASRGRPPAFRRTPSTRNKRSIILLHPSWRRKVALSRGCRNSIFTKALRVARRLAGPTP